MASPDCPDCGSPCGQTLDYEGYPIPGRGLMCAACGHRWTASAEDRLRAERADIEADPELYAHLREVPRG